MDNCIKPIVNVKVTGEGIDGGIFVPVPQWSDIEHAVLDLGDSECLKLINAQYKAEVTNKARVKAQEGMKVKDKMVRAAVKAAGSDPVKLANLGEVIAKIMAE